MIWHAEGKPNLDGVQPFEREPILALLSKDPDERFPTCRAFVNAMLPPEPEPIESLLPPPPRRLRLPMLLAALATALPLVAALLWLTLRERPIGTPKPTAFQVPDAKLVPVGGKIYYDRIVKEIPGFPAEFVLIAKEVRRRFRRRFTSWTTRYRTGSSSTWPASQVKSTGSRLTAT